MTVRMVGSVVVRSNAVAVVVVAAAVDRGG